MIGTSLTERRTRLPKLPPSTRAPSARLTLLVANVVLGLLALPCSATDYMRDIKPLLAEKCYACHGALKQEAGLRLETASLIRNGGDSGPAIVPGDPALSLLIERITADDDIRMPPRNEGARLTTEEVSRLSNWIDSGAIAPEEPIPDAPLAHWAYRPITRPVVPRPPCQAANPIDAFLYAKQRERGVRAQPIAPRSLLVRRLYLDLIGLPPTLQQLHDPRPWNVIVDELLTSPQHGERWARHWMDVWRYSDWYGLGEQLRYSQKHIWHWRDWIVESLNEDKGYDSMVLEMLAGDELAPQDADTLRATGFLARNYYLFNRTTWLDQTLEHTAKSFLGMTLNCAKCHDHKYDPVSQQDYYRMRAIFEPHQVRLDPVPGVVDWEQDGLPRVFDNHPDLPTYLHVRGDPQNFDENAPVAPGVPQIFADWAPAINAVPLPVTAYAPSLREHVRDDHLREADHEIARRERVLADAVQDLRQVAESTSSSSGAGTCADSPDSTPANEESLRQAVATARAQLDVACARRHSLAATFAADQARFGEVVDETQIAATAQIAAVKQAELKLAEAVLDVILSRQDETKKANADERKTKAQQQLDAARAGKSDYTPIRGAKKALETPAHQETDYDVIYPRNSTGRRLALARWLVDRRNPLTARVAVNHVWMRHFGRPLVESVFDFGLRCEAPEHQALLDYLACELIDSGWSLRHLHRMIVTSQAYQRSSSAAGADATNLAADSQNTLYWRMPSRRMESEVIRDSLLHLAGVLDTTLGGPPVDPRQGGTRRSLYFQHSRDQQDKFLSMFDDADILQCYRRQESIVPQQALALANSQLALSMSAKIAEAIQGELPTDGRSEFVNHVFETLLAREPEEAERQSCLEYCDALAALVNDEQPDVEKHVRGRLVHALLNHNDFVTIR
ncbi:MAG: PSD1 domain-containing protein [Planctomycetales bacterium]|nr:PSD1 domain-containing protein [Planctomycetales bacterium]